MSASWKLPRRDFGSARTKARSGCASLTPSAEAAMRFIECLPRPGATSTPAGCQLMTASGALLPLGRIDADGSSCPRLRETLTPTELDAEIGPVGHDRGDGCRKAQKRDRARNAAWRRNGGNGRLLTSSEQTMRSAAYGYRPFLATGQSVVSRLLS